MHSCSLYTSIYLKISIKTKNCVPKDLFKKGSILSRFSGLTSASFEVYQLCQGTKRSDQNSDILLCMSKNTWFFMFIPWPWLVKATKFHGRSCKMKAKKPGRSMTKSCLDEASQLPFRSSATFFQSKTLNILAPKTLNDFAHCPVVAMFQFLFRPRSRRPAAAAILDIVALNFCWAKACTDWKMANHWSLFGKQCCK